MCRLCGISLLLIVSLEHSDLRKEVLDNLGGWRTIIKGPLCPVCFGSHACANCWHKQFFFNYMQVV